MERKCFLRMTCFRKKAFAPEGHLFYRGIFIVLRHLQCFRFNGFANPIYFHPVYSVSHTGVDSGIFTGPACLQQIFLSCREFHIFPQIQIG